MTTHVARTLLVGTMALALSLPAYGQATHSNTQKYRERNPSAATGRSGSASLAARLLFAKDGTTVAEATTGAFDGATAPPGTISKVQLKAFDALGETMFTSNHGPLSGGGYWTATFDSFAPGQPFQVQANIRGIDGRRTDVVVVTASVQKRPDLSASDLGVPGQATPNTPVQIAATVSELNGQIGARADCVLLVNDVEVDRSSGIWVDSGDAVSCAFSRSFPDVGTQRLSVAAVSVQPGDWDEANNSVSGSIEIVAPSENYNYAYAQGVVYDNYHYSSREDGRYTNSTNTGGYDWVYEYTQDWPGGHDYFYYYAQRWNAVAADLSAVNFSATDGTTTFTIASPATGCYSSGGSVVNGRTVYWYAYSCGGYVETYFQGYAGTVTYMSHSWQQHWRRDASGNIQADPPSEYFYNGTSEYGANRLTGTGWTIDAAVTLDSGTTYSTPLSVTMSTPVDYDHSNSGCSSNTSSGESYTYCWDYGYRYSYRYGYAYFYQP